MINCTFTKSSIKLIALLLSLSILIGSMVSCRLFSYVADTETEISENIAESVANGGSGHNRVADYLRDWGMPIFDTIKFEYFEVCFVQLYNFEDGMPDTLTHAVKTANLFLENYYNVIDKDDKTAVTDGLITCYVVSLDDPYSIYRPPVETEEYSTDMSGKFGGIGVVVEYDHTNETIMINTVYPDSPAEGAGVKVGDFIHAIDGVTVEEIGYTNAVNRVRGEIGTTVELTLLRDGEYITVSMKRAEVEEINVDYSFDEESKIGYVVIVAFKQNTFDQFKKAIDELEKSGAVGIVFDLRNNPGGYVNSVCDVISYLIPTGKTISSLIRKSR